jgi:hypothetical protein
MWIWLALIGAGALLLSATVVARRQGYPWGVLRVPIVVLVVMCVLIGTFWPTGAP